MEVNPKPTPEGDVPGDYPGKTKPSRPFIGDVPGEGSEGPTDIPNKEIHPNLPSIGDIPGEGSEGPTPLYRGQRFGRKGHFGSGHQTGAGHYRMPGVPLSTQDIPWGRSDKSPSWPGPNKWSGSEPGIDSPNPHHPHDMHPMHPDYNNQTLGEREKYGKNITNNPNFITTTGDGAARRRTPFDPNSKYYG